MVVHDSTTVNLYQAVHAALGAVTHDRPTVIAVDAGDFPTDRYVVAGIAAATGATVRRGCDDLAGVDVALRSLVDFRTGVRVDLAAETARAAEHGTMVVWDLSHAAGAVEVDVTGAGVDIAVGCTYKYLHGGPGAPAFTYVRPDRHDTLTSPIWGWCAQRAQFAMGDDVRPAARPAPVPARHPRHPRADGGGGGHRHHRRRRDGGDRRQGSSPDRARARPVRRARPAFADAA